MRLSLRKGLTRPTAWLCFWLLPCFVMADDSADLVAQGNAKKSQGDLKGAAADFTQAIAENPKNAIAYLSRATIRELTGDFAGAIADDTTAITLNPKNPAAFYNRGNAKVAAGDLSGAIADYTQALALDPHHARALLNRGNVKNLQKQYAPALADYSAAIEIDPKNPTAFYNRASAKSALDDYPGALADYNEAIALNPSDVRSYLNRAVLEMVRKQWDLATADLNECLKVLPPEKQAYPRIYLWVIGVHQGKEKQATQELASYVEASPKTFDTTWPWQIEKFLTGGMTEADFLALATSTQMKDNRGQVAKAYYYAGLKKMIAGDHAGAASLFKKCLATEDRTLHEYILAREELKSSDAKTP